MKLNEEKLLLEVLNLNYFFAIIVHYRNILIKMNKYFININVLLICLLICSSSEGNSLFNSECHNRVHRKCNTDQSYTEEELENAKIYIQKRFATTNPIRKPCDKLYVRKDIKCLSPEELKDLIDVFMKLNENRVIAKFTRIHDVYWPANHKFNDGVQWHRWFGNEFEKEMRKINPKVTLPYWDFLSEFKSAEKSIVFDIFGHAGNKDNDYCIPDGPFANFMVNYPNRHCLRRQWNTDGTTPIWEPSEWMTAILQMEVIQKPTIDFFGIVLKTALKLKPERFQLLLDTIVSDASSNKGSVQYYSTLISKVGFVGHFKTHLSLGGYNGDLSIPLATNDPVFYLFHTFVDIIILKWQLQNNKNLVPNNYDLGFKLDWDTQEAQLTDLEKDTFTYYTNITVKETFQLGFGDMCYIYDQMIKPINDILKNKKPKLPEAVHRLKSALPKEKFERYFPKFALYPEEVTFLDYVLSDVGNCNPSKCNGICNKIPVAKQFNETKNGLRQWQKFITEANVDITPYISPLEKLYEEFIHDLNDYNYCSPYV